MKTRHMASLMGALCVTLAASSAAAFCGTFVSGADADLFNSATQVVLMRHGQQTILSMENDYQGPLDDFAMVVPVPQILMQDDVKTLDPIVFRKVDVLGSPRLVEYAEKDPCQDRYYDTYEYTGGCPWDGFSGVDDDFDSSESNNAPDPSPGGGQGETPPPPVIEAQFAVGEYEIVILSAEDSTGLQTWLDSEGYNLPDGAGPVLESYVQQGMYFFVAKVNPMEVTFEDGKALLSPLRFAYTSDDFSLPIRLGLLNSAGEQDLVVNILSTEGRYETSNYPSVHIPTNQLVSDQTREGFGSFYDKLFARTVAENPGAVVTEYAWSWSGFQQGNKCDPCPPPPEGATGSLDENDLSALGNDIVASILDPNEPWYGWTLTRLHARYGKAGVDSDLQFALRGGLIGGAGTSGRDQLDTTEDDVHNPGPQSNRFQGRYIMHRTWDQPIMCEDAVRGRWVGTGDPAAAPGRTTAGPPADISGMGLDSFYVPTDSIPETGSPKPRVTTIDLGPCEEEPPDWWGDAMPPEAPERAGGGDETTDLDRDETPGCSSTGAGAPLGGALAMALAGLVGAVRRRRR